jgi:hypothetical protein
MVESMEKQQLPETPISITVMAYYAGFQVLITRRTGEQPIISQVPGIVSLVNKLVEAGFEPVREMAQPALSTTETKESGKENEAHRCPVHGVEMKKFSKGDQTWYSHKIDTGWCNGKKK